MKKRILIVINAFSVGGTMASLSSLLSVIDPKKVDIDIFSRIHTGPLRHSLTNCRVLPENLWLTHTVVEGGLLMKVISRLLWLLRGLLEKIGIDLYRLYGYIGGKQIGSDKYDAVIGFDETLPRIICGYPAKKRISWLHCDYRRHALGKDESKYYNQLDNIVCVSKFAKDTLMSIYPQYDYKTLVINNVINIKSIAERSCMEIPSSSKKQLEYTGKRPFTMISIGRLDPVKQFEKIPQIASDVKKLLLDNKLDIQFRWLIIGGGNDGVKLNIENEIIKYDVRKEVLMLGTQTNPYPFLALSDLYVCTSSSETFSYTIHEGLALRVPFLCNTFPSAFESVHVGKGGFILSLEEMPIKIVELMQTPLIIKECTISNDKSLNDFYNLI